MALNLKHLGLAWAACTFICVGAVHAAEPKALNIYTWSDYIADDTLQNFEKETGIKVRYDTTTRSFTPNWSPARPATTSWCRARTSPKRRLKAACCKSSTAAS